jgi:hypothetical protein
MQTLTSKKWALEVLGSGGTAPNGNTETNTPQTSSRKACRRHGTDLFLQLNTLSTETDYDVWEISMAAQAAKHDQLAPQDASAGEPLCNDNDWEGKRSQAQA